MNFHGESLSEATKQLLNGEKGDVGPLSAFDWAVLLGYADTYADKDPTPHFWPLNYYYVAWKKGWPPKFTFCVLS